MLRVGLMARAGEVESRSRRALKVWVFVRVLVAVLQGPTPLWGCSGVGGGPGESGPGRAATVGEGPSAESAKRASASTAAGGPPGVGPNGVIEPASASFMSGASSDARTAAPGWGCGGVGLRGGGSSDGGLGGGSVLFGRGIGCAAALSEIGSGRGAAVGRSNGWLAGAARGALGAQARVSRRGGRGAYAELGSFRAGVRGELGGGLGKLAAELGGQNGSVGGHLIDDASEDRWQAGSRSTVGSGAANSRLDRTYNRSGLSLPQLLITQQYEAD